jgi:hypothetical protein
MRSLIWSRNSNKDSRIADIEEGEADKEEITEVEAETEDAVVEGAVAEEVEEGVLEAELATLVTEA